MHRHNAMLPPAYREALPQEADTFKALLFSELTARDAKTLTRFTRRLQTFKELKYPLSPVEKADLARGLLKHVFGADAPLLQCAVQTRLMKAAHALLRRKPAQLPLKGIIQLDWRQFYEVLSSTYFSGDSYAPSQSAEIEAQHRRTLGELIHTARHYWTPGADREIWALAEPLLRDPRSLDIFRGMAILLLFLPSESAIYGEQLRGWMQLWAAVDHCPWWDAAWLTLFCRARKSAATLDWVVYLPQICAQARLVVPTPVGQGPQPDARQVPVCYRQVVPAGSDYAKIKLAKLLVFCVRRAGGGPATTLMPAEHVAEPLPCEGPALPPGRLVSSGARLVIGLLRSYRNYFFPSNVGNWTVPLASLTVWIAAILAREVGAQAARDELAAGVASAGGLSLAPAAAGAAAAERDGEMPPLRIDDTTALIEALLPLTHELLYSKYPQAQELAQRGLRVLAGLSPRIVAPATLGLALRAVDPVAATVHTHQAPAAIRALGVVLQPLLYPRPLAAPFLPALLEYTLPGIDANDVTKTISTGMFYLSVMGWLPILGGRKDASGSGSGRDVALPSLGWVDSRAWPAGTDESEREEAYEALEALGEGPLLEWALALLDRLLRLMENRGKAAKSRSQSGLDTMNTAAALSGSGAELGGLAALAGGRGGGRDTFLSYVIGSLARLLFQQMDPEALRHAARKVGTWVAEAVVPDAAKDAASLLSCLATADPVLATGLLLPQLASGLAKEPARVVAWRLRLLSGLCTVAGSELPGHAATLVAALRVGFAHEDRTVRKSAGKLLRRALAALCECYPVEARSLPPDRWPNAGTPLEWRRVGQPPREEELNLRWHEPTRVELRLAAQLIEEFVVGPADALLADGRGPSGRGAGTSSVVGGDGGGGISGGPAAVTLAEARRAAIKRVEYGVRGCLSLLADLPGPQRDDAAIACGSALLERLRGSGDDLEGERLYTLVSGLRQRLLCFVHESLQVWARPAANGGAASVAGSSYGAGGGGGSVDIKLTRALLSLGTRLMVVRGADADHVVTGLIVLRMYRRRQNDQKAIGYAREMLSQLPATFTEEEAAAARLAIHDGTYAAPRHMLAERAYLQHLRRQHAAPSLVSVYLKHSAGDVGKACLAPYETLFADLLALASHPYATVRAAAQDAVASASRIFSFCIEGHLPALLDRIAVSPALTVASATLPESRMGAPPSLAPLPLLGHGAAVSSLSGASGLSVLSVTRGGDDAAAAAADQLTGALYVLHNQRFLRRIASRWPLLSRFLLSICASQGLLAALPADRQVKAAARLQILFTAFLSLWDTPPQLTPEDTAAYEALVSGLLALVTAGGTSSFNGGDGMDSPGDAMSTDSEADAVIVRSPPRMLATQSALAATWRRELMASWALNMLVSARPLGGDDTSSGSGTAGVIALVPVWRWFASALTDALDRAPLQELSLSALNRLLGHRAHLEHKAAAAAATSAGGNGGVGPDWAVVSVGSEATAALPGTLSSPSFFKALIRALAMDHGRLGEAPPGQDGRSQRSAGVEEMVSEAGRVGADSWSGFPTIRVSPRSSVFSPEAAALIERLVRLCGGATILPALAEAAAAGHDAAPPEERRAFNCAAAETVAGAARALCGAADVDPSALSYAVSSGSAFASEFSSALALSSAWEVLLPLVEQGIAAAAPSGAGADWCDALRWYMAARPWPGAAAAPLLSFIVARAAAVLRDGRDRADFAAQAAALQMLQSALIEAAATAPTDAVAAIWLGSAEAELGPLLVAAMDHPFDACRNEISRCLLLLTCWSKTVDSSIVEAAKEAAAGDGSEDESEAAAAAAAALRALTVGGDDGDAVLVSLPNGSDGGGGGAEGQREAAKALGRRRETLVLWLSQGVRLSDISIYLPTVVKLLPMAFESVTSGAELAAMGRYALMTIAQSLMVRWRGGGRGGGGRPDDDDDVGGAARGDDVSQLVQAIVGLLSHSVWHVRQVAVQFAAVVRTKSLFVLTAAEHAALDAAASALLADPRREVQEQARMALTTRAAVAEAADAAALCQHFVAACDEAAAVAKKRRKLAKTVATAAAGAAAAAAAADPAAEKRQQAAVLGLASLVLSAPYDVPTWLPRALVALGRHADGRLLVGDTVAHAFKEFRRTHQEDPLYRERFSAEELDVLNETAPVSYMM